MVSQVVVDGAELVEGLRVVVLQLGRGLQVADGLPHLSHLDETLGSHLARRHIPDADLWAEEDDSVFRTGWTNRPGRWGSGWGCLTSMMLLSWAAAVT